MTIEEHCKKPLNKVKVAFPGDVRSNLSRAWMIGAAKMGLHYVALGPEPMARKLDGAFLKEVFAQARANGGLIEITDDMSALKGADVLYGSTWASVGEEELIPEQAKLLAPYRVTEETLEATGNPEVLYLHCLPALHDYETVMVSSCPPDTMPE